MVVRGVLRALVATHINVFAIGVTHRRVSLLLVSLLQCVAAGKLLLAVSSSIVPECSFVTPESSRPRRSREETRRSDAGHGCLFEVSDLVIFIIRHQPI